MDRVGKNIRNTQDNNGKSPEIRLSVLIIQVDRIANSNSITALFQFKGSLCNDCMVVSCITGNSATVFIMEQINFTCLIALSRINICYNTVRSKLYTFNRIRYKIFCNRIKLLDISISTDQNLFQSICDRNSICNFIFNTFAVG